MASKNTWQFNKMMALVRGLEFKTVQEYFDYIISSKINGQTDQCCKLFRDMPKEYRKDFLSSLVDETKYVEYHDEYETKQYYHDLLTLLIEKI